MGTTSWMLLTNEMCSTTTCTTITDSRVGVHSCEQCSSNKMREDAVKKFVKQQRKINFEEAYRVGAVLGKGGFGIVYAGVRSKDRREVAIKHVARNKVEHWANLNGKRVPLEHLRGVPEPHQELSENPTQRQDWVGADPESPLVEERRRRHPNHRPQSPRCSSAQPHSLQLLKGVCLELLLRNRCPLLFLLKVPD